jgi:hypothetical protein
MAVLSGACSLAIAALLLDSQLFASAKDREASLYDARNAVSGAFARMHVHMPTTASRTSYSDASWFFP